MPEKKSPTASVKPSACAATVAHGVHEFNEIAWIPEMIAYIAYLVAILLGLRKAQKKKTVQALS